MKREKLVEAAKELNKELEFDKPIDVDKDRELALLKKDLIEGHSLIEEGEDVISDETMDVLKTLVKEEETSKPEEEEKEMVATKKKATKKKVVVPTKAKAKVKVSGGGLAAHFMAELKKGPKKMADIKKAKWNPKGGTFYVLFNSLVSEGKAKKDKDGKMVLK